MASGGGGWQLESNVESDEWHERSQQKQNCRGAIGEEIKREMRTPQGGSKTWTSWHRIRMILNSGVEPGDGEVKVQGEQYKAHTQENPTWHPDGALQLRWDTLQGHSRYMRPWDHMRPHRQSRLYETSRSLSVGKRHNQKCIAKKASLAVAWRDRSGRETSRKATAPRQVQTMGEKPESSHTRTCSHWNLTSSILEKKHRAWFWEAVWFHTELSSKSGSLVSTPNSSKT